MRSDGPLGPAMPSGPQAMNAATFSGRNVGLDLRLEEPLLGEDGVTDTVELGLSAAPDNHLVTRTTQHRSKFGGHFQRFGHV